MISVVLHGTALGASVAVLGNLELAPEPEPFTWEVSLVDTNSPAAEPAMSEPAPQPVEPKPVQKPQPPKPPVEQKVVQPPQPVQKVEPPPHVVEEPPPPKVEEKIVEQKTEEKPVETIHEAMTAIPRAAEPQPSTQAHESPAPMETKIETKGMAKAEPPPPVEQRAVTPPAPPQPIQEAMLRPQPAAPSKGKKTDFGWLANALWERVSHLQKYPHQARIRNVEGRVVLRAVITANGQLAKAEVVTSSGSALLDEDALATLHKACPLHLAKPLDRAEVVVMIPINYRLN